MSWGFGMRRSSSVSTIRYVLVVVVLCTQRSVKSFNPSTPLHSTTTNLLLASRTKPSYKVWSLKRRETAIKQKHESDSDSASKGFVSVLTSLVNSVADGWSMLFRSDTINPSLSTTDSVEDIRIQKSPPKSSQELLDRIRDDYTMKNYLWTGDLDLNSNFDPSCRFTDPTLSFTGTDHYAKNIQNLRPILDRLTNISDCRSELLQIQSYDGYIQTRWNMLGTLTGLPWQPRIDVMGRTKFWYNNDTFQIYFYDEIWEIPASQALLQLITPGNSIQK